MYQSKEEKKYKELRSYICGALLRKGLGRINEDEREDLIHDIIEEMLKRGIYNNWRKYKKEVSGIIRDIVKKYKKKFEIEIISYDSEPYEYLEDEITDNSLEEDVEISDILEKLEKYLTERELEIVDMLLKGYNQAEISRMLRISRAAVTKHMRKIKDIASKLNLW